MGKGYINLDATLHHIRPACSTINFETVEQAAPLMDVNVSCRIVQV